MTTYTRNLIAAFETSGNLSPDLIFNAAMLLIDAIIGGCAEDKDLAADPTTVAGDVGKVWIIAASGSGDWTGKATGTLAICTAADTWQYLTPWEGLRLWVKDEDRVYNYDGSAWAPTLGAIQNSRSAAYTLVLADAGKQIFHPSADTTARTWTIPANASVPYPIGTEVTFVNQNAAGVITVAITTDTMRLAGAGTTGSRTLAANGVAVAQKITATEWIISGTGLT